MDRMDEWKKQQQLSKWIHRTFHAYQGSKIAVYGIGVNAKRVLSCEGFTFSAVAAKDHFGEMFCGREIVPLDVAIGQSDRMIIAATKKATQEVFDRIGPHIPAGYPVMDLYGHVLNEQVDVKDAYWEKTLAGLKKEIDAHDVISFDIFDTLLMRKTLEPRDVFAMEERELQSQGEEIPFATWRPAAEIEQLQQGYFPNFDEIYRYLQEQHGLTEETVRRWKQREWEIENEVLVPREDLVEALRYAKAQGKTVCLTSDMYFSKPDMERLLEAKNITGYDAVFVSCDFQASKGDGGLFRSVLDLAHDRSVLHIGDNEQVDDFVPYQLGIDTYPIRKASDLLATSSCTHILGRAESLADRIMLGGILAKWFQSPFALAATKGRVTLESTKKLAWMCFLPLTVRFLQFIVKTAQEAPDAILLFLSRDGYFLQKVYESLRPKLRLPPSVYFYASRQASYGAMVRDEEDLKFCLEYISGLTTQNLKHQLEFFFQIPFPKEFDRLVEEAVEDWGAQGLQDRVMEYKDRILSQEARHRNGYLRYMEPLRLDQYQRILCVDLVTKGTVSFALQRILGRPVELIALSGVAPQLGFLPAEEARHLCLGILSPFSLLNVWFPIMEMLYASKGKQLKGFSAEGTPVFVEHSEYDPALLDRMQEALAEGLAFTPMLFQMPEQCSENFCCNMADLLDERYTDIANRVYEEFAFNDPGDSRTDDTYNVLRYLRQGTGTMDTRPSSKK